MGMAAIIASLLNFSCSKSKKEFTIPEDVIPKEKMVKVLADVHVAEAAINLRNVQVGNARELNASMYKDVFLKHGISKDDFEKSYIFYSENSALFNEVYDNVITELTRQQAAEEKTK